MVPMRRYPQALMTSAQDPCGVTHYNVDIIEVVNHVKNDQRLTTRVGISKVRGRDRRMHMHSLRIYN